VRSLGRSIARGATRRPFLSLLAGLAAIVLLAVPAHAFKRVICIDGAGDRFLSNAEGYYRASFALPGDVISVGGNLTDCMAQLQDGDNLYIVTHGGNNGGTFVWGGQDYTGFGDGNGLMPLPPGFGARRQVDVQLVWCYSGRDPDGAGPDKPFRQKMIDILGGPNSGNTVGGYLNAVITRVTYSVRGGTRAQQDAAFKCLDDDKSWLDKPPVNRPGAQVTQLTAAEAIVDNCPGAGAAVTVVIPNRVGNDQQSGYWHPFQEIQAQLQLAACGCEVCDDCGCGDAIGIPDDATTSSPHRTWGQLKLIYR